MTTEQTCGKCSLCCKLPCIGELDKPIDTWCRHAAPGRGGCSIYPVRPRSCSTFVCAWLSGEIDDAWFPAGCKMVVIPRVPPHLADEGVLVMVDPAYPDAWRREPYHTQLRAWARDFVVDIRVGLRCISLNADGTEHEVRRTQAWIEGRPETS